MASTLANAESELAVRAGYVLVRTTVTPTAARAVALFAAIDDALLRHGIRAAVFDTRETPAPPPAARKLWWEWLETAAHHDRVGVVVRSELTRISGNMTALSRKVRLRSFENLRDAQAWVLAA